METAVPNEVKNGPDRGHIGYFDWLRAFAVMSVIAMHTVVNVRPEELNTRWHIFNVCLSLAFTAVPLFLMMSGCLLLSEKEALKGFEKTGTRVMKLLIPLVTFSCLNIIRFCVLWEDHSVKFIKDLIVKAVTGDLTASYWYMYTLIALYIIAPVIGAGLNSLDEKGRRVVLTIVLALQVHMMIMNLLPASVGRFFDLELASSLKLFKGHLCTFILGWYLGNCKRRFKPALLIAAIAVLWTMVAVGTWHNMKFTGVYQTKLMNQACGFEVIMAACLFLLVKELPLTQKRFPLQSFIKLSLTVYMTHEMIISDLQRTMKNAGLDITGVRCVVLTVLLTAAVCYVFSLAVNTIKPLRRIFTGRKN